MVIGTKSKRFLSSALTSAVTMVTLDKNHYAKRRSRTSHMADAKFKTRRA